jgi:hypothetical protein
MGKRGRVDNDTIDVDGWTWIDDKIYKIEINT